MLKGGDMSVVTDPETGEVIEQNPDESIQIDTTA